VERNVPFREAHHIVGGLVARLTAASETFEDVTGKDLVDLDSRFQEADVDRLDPVRSVDSRKSPGGGSMASVAIQIEALESFLESR